MSSFISAECETTVSLADIASKYLPAGLLDFLVFATSTSASALVIGTNDIQTTLKKIHGNVKDSQFYELQDFYKAVSIAKLQQNVVNVVCTETVDTTRGVLVKRPTQCSLVILTLNNVANQLQVLMKGDLSLQGEIRICEDTLEWNELYSEHKSLVKGYLADKLEIILETDRELNEILRGEVLVDLVNGRYPRLLKETLPSDLQYYVDRRVRKRNFQTDFKEKALKEEEFLLSLENTATGLICICDKPGAGKSTFLARIGNLIKEKYPKRTVIFLQASELIHEVINNTSDNNVEIEEVLENMVCCNKLGSRYLRNRLSSNDNHENAEILLDGLDEVCFENSVNAKNILATIQSFFKSARVWVTSSHRFLPKGNGKEEATEVHLELFNRQDQVQFLVSYWTAENPQLDSAKLNVFATHCLETVQSKIKSKDYAVADIPLQCRMIADICKDLAIHYSSTDEIPRPPPTDRKSIPISNFCQLWISKKTKESTVKERILVETLAQISLEWLFEKWYEKLKDLFPPGNSAAHEEIRKSGLLRISSEERPQLVHKVPAEYFIAWFVADRLSTEGPLNGELVNFLLEELLLCERSNLSQANFFHLGIVYFLNSSLANIPPHRSALTSLSSFKLTKNVVEACVKLDLFPLFKFLHRIHLHNGDETRSEDIFIEDFILSQISYFSLNFFSVAVTELEKSCKLDVSFKTKLFYQCVTHRNLPVMDYLLSKSDLRKYLENSIDGSENSSLLQNFIENSWEDSSEVIREKQSVIQILVRINSGFLEQRNFFERTPLLGIKIHLELLLELIKLGADVLAQDKYKQTILHRSIDRDHLSSRDYDTLVTAMPRDTFLKLVLLKDCNGSTPLGTLVEKLDPFPETLDMFEIAGADFNHVNFNMYSILRTAIAGERNPATLLKLMECGADPLKVELGNNTILHLMCRKGQYWSEYYYSVLAFIPMDKLEKLVRIENDEGMTPLGALMACGDPFPEAIGIFGCGGADFSHVNKEGYPILAVAVREGRNVETIRQLIKSGADVRWRKGWKDKNLLHYAGEMGNTEAVRYLVEEHGFDVNEKARSGTKVLKYAERNGHIATCKVLKELGAT